MFKIKGPILAAMDLDNGSDDLLRQADALARSYNVKLSVCHVLPEIFAVRPLFPQLHLDDALKLSELEAAVRDALLERIRAVRIGSRPKQGSRSNRARCMREYSVPPNASEQEPWSSGERSIPGVCIFWATLRSMSFAMRIVPFLWRGPRLRERYWQRPTFPTPHSLPLKRAQRRHGAARPTLTIIHAIDLLPVMSPFYGEFYGMPPMDLSDQMRKLWQQRLDECVHHFKAKGGGLLRDGPAAPAILSAASELPAQLLVVGTHGRTGLSRIALGSVAEAVVRAAPCSVLTVRFV